MQLVVDNVVKSFGVNTVLKDISFMVDKGEKVGLVGVNGSGKSTLLQCLINKDYIDGGSVRFEAETRIGYVEQGFGSMGEETLWEFLLKSYPEVLALRAKLADLEELATDAHGEALEETLADYASVTKRYEHIDGYHYETRIKIVLNGLGFTEEEWGKCVGLFSGGQKTRILLAAALVKNPDFLILDEPTNHLDIVMTEWLERYLLDFRGGLMIVSHDRAFLDNVVGRVLEISKGKIQAFKGNYTRYLEQKEIQSKTLEAAYAAQQDYIAKTEAYIRRFKAGIKSKMARGRQSQLDRLERIDAPIRNEEFDLRLPHAPEAAERVVILEKLDIGYSAENVLVKNIDLVLRNGQKTALLGANGSGKSTLLKTILGELEPLKGKAQLGNRVQVGYFSQSYERLDESQTILDNFLTEYGFTNERTRSLLGGMLFHGDDVFKEIGTLSGGQKARLVLLKLVLDGANLLVLDEPTNHLDISARESLEAAIAAFDGTVLMVSHDRYFVKELATEIWEITDGELRTYKGDYDFYLAEKQKFAANAVTEETKSKKTEAQDIKTEPKKKVKQEKRLSLDEIEKRLPKIELSIREQEALLGVLEKQIADPANHATPEDSARLAAEHEELKKVIDDLMERWEKLMEMQEELLSGE